MKKICMILLAILLGMSACLPAFADMGGPELVSYTATLNNETPYYDWRWDDASDKSYFEKQGTLPAGTVLTISNEFMENGEMYGYFYDLGPDNLNGYVRVQALSTETKGVYPASSGFKQSVTVRLCVVEPKGVTLYAGPSATYARVATVPQGTELTVDTLDQDGFETGAWMYVTYNGKSGWTRCWLYDDTQCPMAELLPQGETGTVWVVQDDAMLLDKDGNALVKVPKGEKLTFDSFNRSPHEVFYRVTYQGKSGFFSLNDDGNKNFIASDKFITSYRNMQVVQDITAEVCVYPEDTQSVGTVTYQTGDTLHSTYLFYGDEDLSEAYRGGKLWLYIEKDGQAGWIKLDHAWIKFPEDTVNSDLPELYIYDVETEADETTEAPETTEPESAETQTDASEPSETEESTTETVLAVSGRVLSPGSIVGICVAAAAVLALTAVVTLLLIRRKRAG